MNEKNAQALAAAYNRAKAKSLKIKELGITSKITDAATEKLIKALAVKKLEDNPEMDMAKAVKGQRWYVTDLIAFSVLDTADRLDYEYQAAFAYNATEDEMLAELEKAMA